MTESENIKTAVIGLGRIASLLDEDALREKPCTHSAAVAADPDCTLVAGCDTDAERRRLFAEKWQVPVYADADEMIGEHRPRLLVIATHPDSHYRYCRLAADRKIPAVICEKPLAATLTEARKIARLAATPGGPVIIANHERRYSADYVRAKAVLDGGELGRTLSVRAVLYMGAAKRLLDVLWHDGTHLADAVMFLTSRRLKHRKSRGAKLTSRTGTAWLEGSLEGEPPIPAVIEVGAGRDHLVFEIEFSCERGRLKIGNGVFEIWQSAPSPYAENFRSLSETGAAFPGPTGYFANMVRNAAACAKTPGHRPVSAAADGLRVIEYLSSVKRW